MELYQNVKFKTKLYFGYASILVPMIILAIFVYFSLKKLENDRYWVNHTHDAIRVIQECGTLLVDMETGVMGFLVSGDEQFLEPYEEGKNSFEKLWNYGRDLTRDNPAQINRWDNLRSKKEIWLRTVATPEIDLRRKINTNQKMFSDVKAFLEEGSGKRLMGEIRLIVAEMVQEEKELLTQRGESSEQRSTITIMINVLGTAFTIMLGSVIALFVLSAINRQLGTDPENLVKLADDLALGDLSILDLSETKNVSGVYEAFIQMVINLKAMVQQTEVVSLGEFDKKIELRSEKDQLGIAINRMTDSLKEASEKNNNENYLRSGHSGLNNELRGEQSLDQITDKTIRFLSEYLQAQVGAFYLLAENEVLELVATYAYQKRKSLSDQFKIGEGLVGQAAREKKPILISDVPDDYIHIASGLGKSAPASIIVYPIKHESELLGVIELGSLQGFSDLDLKLFEEISRSIAIALKSAESRDNMAQLLDKTQNQSEKLQSQQEELRESNEILEAQKQSLIESETRLQDQQEELHQTNEELEEQTQMLEEQKTSIQGKNAELKITQNEIEEKARDLEMASKYKSEFLANMSHELRTPLNSVLLLSKLLAEDKEKRLTEKQREYSQTIHMSGTELLDLINEILDLAKVESGKMEVHLEQVSLDELTQRFKRSFQPQAQNKGLEFNVKIENGLPPKIRTDSQRLEQIIKNLLSNAIKFTKIGSISLEIKRPDADTDLSEMHLVRDETIAFSVNDTGQGIAFEKQKLIFEAFQQADGTTSRNFGGSGLGLSISLELSRLLGGMIRLESDPGKGSSFTIYLPDSLNKEYTSQQKEPVQLQDSPVRKTRMNKSGNFPGPSVDMEVEFIPDDRKNLSEGDKVILIIEDDPRFAKTLSDLAREREYKILVAGDGETGLHFADYYVPDAIILDIGLPGMDGWSVMDRLKEQSKTRHIPVHFISAHDQSIEAKKMGAIGFITKPVTIPLLDQAFEKIAHLISGDIRKLLIVEDDAVQRKAMVELIGNGDVHSTEASSGEEAFGLLTQQTFDCMILDLGLPDVKGVEFLTRIKEDENITEIPVVVYTGKELTSEEEALINEYAEKIIIKGVKSAEKLLDETTLFLHRVEADLPEEKRKMIRVIHDRESVFWKKKILIVDDDMRNVYALTNVLEDKGLEVHTASNGRKGVEILEEHPDIDLVLMDIMMPEMDGYEAMTIIRKKKQFKELPIIALTAKAMKGDRKKCVEMGASDYLAKPVNSNKLLSIMRVWLY